MEQRTIGIIIGIIALVLVGAYAFFAIDKQETNYQADTLPVYSESYDTQDDMVQDESVDENTEPIVGDEPLVQVETEVEVSDDESSVTLPGSYETYGADKLARANSGDVVLFFHAPWCPSCRALDRSINASLNEIPAGLTILQTDYDSNTELRQKYGVTYQHTLVQVDANGNLIKKWSGGSDLSSITSQVQ